MKKVVVLFLILLLTNTVMASPFCIKEPVCVKEPEKGLYVIKVNTKEYNVRPYIIEEGFATSESVYKNNNFQAVVNGG